MVLASSFVEILKAAVLGLIEGLTEWLPISSTGHMLLADEFIRLNASQAFKDMFIVVIQLGAILAVVVLFWRRLVPFGAGASRSDTRSALGLWGKILIACVPAVVAGLFLDDLIEELFFHNAYVSAITVALALIVYGVLFIVVERFNRGKASAVGALDDLTYKTALFIGLFQLLSLVPGTSRSGATILGAILLGVSRPVAAEFSFLLSIPVMFGASFLKLYKFGLSFTGLEAAVLLTGAAVAFIVSIIAIRFLMNYLKRHDFTAFGWYRIALGLVVLLYFVFVSP